MLFSGAQHPLAHCDPTAHRAAHETPVTVDVTHTAFAQQPRLVHDSPGWAHVVAQ